MKRSEPITTNEFSYTIIIEPAEEGGFVVTCPALRGLATQGETLEEARAMAADAIQGYLECLQEDGLSLPPSDQPLAEPIRDRVTVKLTA
jgi:predicted RNase H-like HicB family nuclease